MLKFRTYKFSYNSICTKVCQDKNISRKNFSTGQGNRACISHMEGNLYLSMIDRTGTFARAVSNVYTCLHPCNEACWIDQPYNWFALLINRHGKMFNCFNFEQSELSKNISSLKISQTTVHHQLFSMYVNL